MPETKVLAYRERQGANAIVYDWIQEQDRTVQVRCFAAIRRLRQMGYELRRPEVDLLRDDIWELRIKVNRIHYRILYSFVGRNEAILILGCTKTDRVPPTMIDRAVRCVQQTKLNTKKHIASFEIDSIN